MKEKITRYLYHIWKKALTSSKVDEYTPNFCAMDVKPIPVNNTDYSICDTRKEFELMLGEWIDRGCLKNMLAILFSCKGKYPGDPYSIGGMQERVATTLEAKNKEYSCKKDNLKNSIKSMGDKCI